MSVDEVADVGEDLFAEFYAEKFRAGTGAEVVFEALEDGSGEIGLRAKHPDQGGAVGGVLIIARQSASRPDGQRERNGCGAWVAGSLGDEIHSHARYRGTGSSGAQ